MCNKLRRLLLVLCVITTLANAYNVNITYKMGKTTWGRMTQREFCPATTYVIGFRLQVQCKQGLFSDDTALNGIQLKCSDGNSTGQLAGPHGEWGTFRQCTGGRHVTGFNLRSEGEQMGDTVAATDVKMQCSDPENPLYGNGLSWGSWQVPGYQECPPGSYFCGIQARIEQNSILDSTGLNEMIFICCQPTIGNWGMWTSWSSCSTSCNVGIRRRTRKCDEPKGMESGFPCIINGRRKHVDLQFKNCRMSPCPQVHSTRSLPLHRIPQASADASIQKGLISHSTMVIMIVLFTLAVLSMPAFMVWKRREYHKMVMWRAGYINIDDEVVKETGTPMVGEDWLQQNSLNQDGHSTPGDSCTDHYGKSKTVHVFAENVQLDDKIFPDLPPAYEEIEEMNANTLQTTYLPPYETTSYESPGQKEH